MIKNKNSLFAVIALAAASVAFPQMIDRFVQPAEARFFGSDTGFADLTERLSPAVVNISTTSTVVSSPVDEFFSGQVPPEFNDILKNFLNNAFPEAGSARRNVSSLGSGFVIDPAGFIVTNNHVVEKAEKIEVAFSDGRNYPAKVIGSDPKTDLALLKIEGKSFPFVEWGDSAAVRPGEWALAIGNPYGLSGSVSAGIISAVNRNIEAGPYDDFIQTDAAINRGNSGGPLFNIDGKVIGVNSAIISPSGGSVGVGFAIPSSLAKDVINQLRQNGKVERGRIGVIVQPLTKDIAESLGYSFTDGAMIAEVSPNGPAEKAGLRRGDIILEFNGKKVTGSRDLAQAVAQAGVHRLADIKIRRMDEGVKNLSVRIERTDDDDASGFASQTPSNSSASLTIFDVKVSDLSREIRSRYNLNPRIKGVAVTAVKDAAQTPEGLIEGDVITEIQRIPVENINQLKDLTQKIKASRKNPILLTIYREGVLFFIAVRY